TRFSRDWSSDVCSSDLHQFLVGQRRDIDLLPSEPEVALRFGRLDHIADEPAVTGQVDEPATVLALPRQLLAALTQHLARLFGKEIGRASCRERGGRRAG